MKARWRRWHCRRRGHVRVRRGYVHGDCPVLRCECGESVYFLKRSKLQLQLQLRKMAHVSVKIGFSMSGLQRSLAQSVDALNRFAEIARKAHRA